MNKEKEDVEKDEEMTQEISEIEKVREELRLQEERYMHALADGENRTKRMQKEKQEMMKFSVQKCSIRAIADFGQF